MTKVKAVPIEEFNEEMGSKVRVSEKSDFIESPLVHEEFTNRLVFSSTSEEQKSLLLGSRDYQIVESLYNEIKDSSDLSFSDMKRKALNIIDDKFETFRKVFSLPTELVALPIKCKNGVYYLSVNPKGYLCFYTDVSKPVNKRLSLLLVKSDSETKSRKSN